MAAISRKQHLFPARCGPDLMCSAVFSTDPEQAWRYELRRVWERRGKLVAFVGLNPSTADETHDDPTVRRCIGFAERWGYGGLIMLNAFAFRATDPYDMITADDPVGTENDRHILAATAEASLTVVAWGNHGRWAGRSAHLMTLMGRVSALDINTTGEPRHPLYVRGDTKPIAYQTAISRDRSRD